MATGSIIKAAGERTLISTKYNYKKIKKNKKYFVQYFKGGK